ncbi:hypothetical protein M231_07566 [Tremella mesenterica]|uniref:Ndc10 domain-containing protein n=1 Tax=Tremella mesenterica TaxID=5217 RepID=A0A4Q1BE00_TREME|nr:hypothetical protein M231_07566 [Tremella mesenterica]
MPRHLKQNPNTLRNVPYVAPQARNAVDETVSLQQYKHKETTIRQYTTRQKKWFKWVASKPWLTEATVTPQLALLFLYEVVLVSKTQKQSKVVDPTGENDLPLENDDLEAIDTTRGSSTVGLLRSSCSTAVTLSIILECQVTGATVHAWVAALVNLWEQQVERGINSWSSPRSVHTATIISVLQKFSERRKKLLHEDKGKQLYYDGYDNVGQLKQSFAHYMERNNEEGLRDALAQATGIFGMLRGDNQRRLLLSDLSSEIATNEGPSPCLFIIMVLHSSKTNASGKPQYAAFMRNKNPQICPVFLLALYLFARLYCGPSPSGFPDMSTRANWYDIPLLSDARDRSKEISYDTQRRAINGALQAANVHTYQKTHVNRRMGARLAEQGGASPDEIARAGHWAHSVLEIHYLTHVPRRTLRAHAGFPIEGNGFFLPRAVTPPSTLLKKVFPEAEKWLSLMNAVGRSQEELTGRMFLQTIMSLREVFLQDVPHLRKAYPSLYIFNHPLFADEEYLRYEGHALTRTITNEKQYDDRIAQALPILHDLLQTQTRAQQQSFQDILGNVLQLSQGQMEQREQMKAVSDGVMLIQTALNRPLIIPGPLQALLAEISSGNSQPSNISDNHLIPSTSSGSEAIPLASSSSLSVTLQATSDVSLPYLQDPLQTTILTPFTMNRTVCTVQELWQEYTLGINGRPSIQSQYESSSNGLKQASETEKRFYRRRMNNIRAVKDLASAREVNGKEAAQLWDKHRQSLQNPSLDALQNWLNKASSIDRLSI